ncbi:MAG: hypothetical protein ACRC80_08510 [Waterburya sp.]
MDNATLDALKIQNFPGINDVPVPATANKAGNGSDLISRVNSLIEELKAFNTLISGQIDSAVLPAHLNHANHAGLTALVDAATKQIRFSLSQEIVQDYVSTLFAHAFHTGLTATYDDTSNRINFALVQENIQDLVSTLFAHAAHTGLTATYDDVSNQIKLAVPPSSGGGSSIGHKFTFGGYDDDLETDGGFIKVTTNKTSVGMSSQMSGSVFLDSVSSQSMMGYSAGKRIIMQGAGSATNYLCALITSVELEVYGNDFIYNKINISPTERFDSSNFALNSQLSVLVY